MGDFRDRLSELPDGLIHLIFSKLEMRDVVRTSLVSRRWVNLWTTVKCFDFEIRDIRTSNFITRVLQKWNGAKIREFKIRVPVVVVGLDMVFCDMGLWVNLAIERNVEVLHIQLLPTENQELCFWPPRSLFSSSSIRTLTLSGCRVEGLMNVSWGQLKSLVVEGGELTQYMIDRVVSGSPNLETLRLLHWVRPHEVSIRSGSLKTLEIASRCLSPPTDTLLTIRAPKLEVLSIRGRACKKCLLMDAFSLSHVILGFTDKSSLLGETLRQILPAIRRVEVVELSFDCSEVFRVGGGGGPSFPPFLNVKHLGFACCPDNRVKDIVGILEIFPKIERLSIDLSSAYSNHNLILDELQDVGGEFMQQLKRVDIVWSSIWRQYDDSIFGFIESLLKHAKEVRKMVIRNTGGWTDESVYNKMVENQLTCLQSSFPEVELVLLQK